MDKLIPVNNTIEQEINVDSLWLISERDKTGKHKNICHGNFIPQIPNQLIRRYTKENDIILEPFAGSGTTLFECENLNRKYIGFDINQQMIDYIKDIMGQALYRDKYYIENSNSLDKKEVDRNIKIAYNNLKTEEVQFVLMHPPYMDM